MKRIIWFFILVFLIISFGEDKTSFARNVTLRTELIEDADIEGDFSLILYGSRHINDVETIAIFDIEGDRYTIEPFAPDFDYRIMKGLSAREALHEAQSFVSWHQSYMSSHLSRILDDDGSIVGYELRPLYLPLTFGLPDVMYVYYTKKNGKIVVNIRLKPSVERQLFQGDSKEWRSH
jgi:hypothetical protein